MKKVTIITGVLAASLLIGLSGCLEEIDLEIPTGTEEKVVIQGKLQKGNPSVAEVSVTRLFDFTSASLQRLVLREVRLFDESGRSIELEPTDANIYQVEIFPGSPDFSVEIGQSYKLRVVTLDNRTYESTLEPLLATPEPANLRAAPVQKTIERNLGEFVERDFIRFFVSTPLAVSEGAQRSRLRWEAKATYRITDSPIDPRLEPKTCYVLQTEGIQQIEIFDGTAARENEITDYTVLDKQVGGVFAEGYYLSVYQEALSEGAFRYFQEMDNLIERSGSIFEPPAGKIRTNFRNVDDPEDEVFGYFYAAEQKVVRLYVSPDFAGNPTKTCPPMVPPPQGGGCPLTACCDCLDAGEESSVIRPPFWVE